MKSLHLFLLVLFGAWLNAAAAQSPYDAARNGDLETLRQYRFEGIDLFVPDDRGFIPYELAALYADPEEEDVLRRHVEVMLWLKEYQPEKHTYGRASTALVQAGLQALGYEVGTADGIFGQKTQEAIKAFQRDNDLAETGRLGPQWLGLFYQDVVKDLQFKLSKIGYSTQGTDGKMGSRTRSAIGDFRREKALANPDYPYLDGLLISSVDRAFNTQEKRRKAAIAEKSRQKALKNTRFAQAGLRGLGYRIGAVDGMAGSKTVNAIKAFQKKNKLNATGELDRKTLQVMQTAFTKDAQKKLKALGYATGKPDGQLGKRTLSAIQKYRSRHRLGSGRVDAALLNSLQNNYSSIEAARKTQQADSQRRQNRSRVRFAQAGLRTLGKPISVDGMMGKTTAKHIKSFQKRYKLKRTGRVDNKTYAKMRSIFLKETQRKLNALGFKTGKPDGQMGGRTKVAIKKFRQRQNMSGTGLTADLIAAVDDAYDNRGKKRRTSKTRVTPVVKSTPAKRVTKTSTTKTAKVKPAKSKPTPSKNNSAKVSKPKAVVASKGTASGRSAKGRMSFSRKNGRVVGCNLAGRNIPIEWCEPFYPLPKNNHCEATFKPSNGAVINLWCK